MIMKKIYLIVSALFYSSFIYCQNGVNLTNFDNDFLKILLEEKVTYFKDSWDYVDQNGDGIIQQSEADKITYLNIENLETTLSSLKGIENFRNLEYLYCSNQEFKTLDLTKLKKLKVFDCFYNKIEELHIEGLPELKEINISRDNENLKTISLKGIKKLLKFRCSSKYLTVTNFEADSLKYLECYFPVFKKMENKVKSSLRHLELLSGDSLVNIQNYDKLTRFYAEDTNYAEIIIEDISFENCPNLESINCSGISLNAMYFKGLPKLYSLTCHRNNLTSIPVEDLTNLTVLDCGINKLDQIDVSGLTNLTGLSCNGNNLKSLDLKNLSKLNFLNCGYNKLTEITIDNQKDITRFNCSGNLFTSIYLKYLSKLTYLECGGSDNLETIILKNISLQDLRIWESKSLKHICVDELLVSNYKSMVSIENCSIDSDCIENKSKIPFKKPDITTIENAIKVLVKALQKNDLKTLKYICTAKGYEELHLPNKEFAQRLIELQDISKKRGVKKFYANGRQFEIEIKGEKYTSKVYLFNQFGEWRYYGMIIGR